MSYIQGTFNAMNFITIVEYMFRIMAYIAFISVAFKAIQALNIYMYKNSR